MRRALVIVAVFVAGCRSAGLPSVSADALLIDPHGTFEPRERLTRQEVERDLSVFVTAFENGYGGYRHIPAVHRASLRERLEQILDVDGEHSSASLCEALDDLLFEIPDNHLHARLGGKRCSRKRPPWPKPSVGDNLLADGELLPWAKQSVTLQDGRAVPVISIRSFPPHEANDWDGFSDAVESVRDSFALVIDLRGNSGGDDTQGLWMAETLYGGEVPPLSLRRIKRQTPETAALAVNAELWELMFLQSNDKPVPKYVTERLEERRSRFAEAKSGALPPERVIEYELPERGPDLTQRFAGPIRVLVDRRCASSCEGTVAALKAHPNVKLVGENTGGFKHFGNVGLLVLPNSHIELQLATDFLELRNGLFIERVGFDPDIRVHKGHDALEAALAELSCSDG